MYPQAYDLALAAFRTYRGDPIAHLDEAIGADPAFTAGHVAKAMILLTFFERRFMRNAIEALDAGNEAIQRGSSRDRAVAAAARTLAQGDWARGVAMLDQVLVDHPNDLVSLQVAHLVDFVRGDALNLRNRVARVLPRWDRSAPGYSYVLGMHAFGLEECNQYPEAEAAGLRALALAPDDCWAVHAVTHVMEMQGRVEEGIEFLEKRRDDWATPDNGFAFHNWWHLALFHLDRGDFAAALEIYDRVLAGAHGMAMSRLDATALLWRLWLEGADTGARLDAVADAWAGDLESEGGFYAFNDFHAALAFAASGREQEMKRLRDILDSAARGPGSNGEMSRTVGIDLVEGVRAYAAGRYRDAVERIAAVRDHASRFGGSHAQRDLLTLTLVEAARRAGEPRLAQHYAGERLVQKPAGRWGARIMDRIHAGEAERACA